MKRRMILQQYVYTISAFLKAFHRVTERELDTVFSHLVMNQCRHICIERLHQLFRALNDGDIHTQFTQIFRELQSDKTAARQHR